MIGGVIFDCDGVVVDREPASFDLLAGELAAHGLNLPRADLPGLLGVQTCLRKVSEVGRGRRAFADTNVTLLRRPGAFPFGGESDHSISGVAKMLWVTALEPPDRVCGC